MKRPMVDYRQFRFSKLNDPQFSHVKLLWSWPAYIIVFFLAGHLIPDSMYFTVYSPLDDMIPFCEIFVLPYVGWYLLIAGSLLYFLLYNVDGFRKLQTFIMITHIIAALLYILLPSRIDLRPNILPDNFFADIVRLLYVADKSTNVCPSMHVGVSLVIASAWVKEKNVSVWFRSFIVLFAFSICLSTMFIKQHSIVDAFAAVAMCLPLEFIIYRDWYREKFKRKKI